MSGRHHRGKRGFTLAELLIVISLLAVIAFLVLPYYRPFVSYSSVKKDAWELMSDLRFYRQLAIVEHVNYAFTFDTGADTYTVEKRDPSDNSLLNAVKTVSLSNNITSATDTIFHPKGNAAPAAEISLKAKNGADAVMLKIYASTGMVRMLE